MSIYQTLVHALTSRPFKIEGNSMLPTLKDGQYVLLTRTSSPRRPLERGDIVVHRHPMGLDGIYVKRIIGLPGEHVWIEGGQVYLDDVPLEEDYPIPNPDQEDPPQKEWWNAAGEYVGMGDNRPNSHADSRADLRKGVDLLLAAQVMGSHLKAMPNSSSPRILRGHQRRWA